MKTVWIISQYTSTPDTGYAGRNFYLAEELAKKGHKVYVIASTSNHFLHTKPRHKESFLLEPVSGFTFVWVKMPLYSFSHSKQRLFNWFIFSWRILSLSRIIKDKPDAILCSSPSLISFLGAERLAKKLSARLIFEVRDIWPLTLTQIGGYSIRHPFIRLLQWVECRAYRKSDRVISNLKFAVNHMLEHGLERSKFYWISNGFSLAEVSCPTPLSPSVSRQLPLNKFIVGYTGTFGLANDLFTLLEAAELLIDIPEIKFVLVGGGKDKFELQQYVIQRKLKNVTFIEYIDKRQIQPMLARFNVLTVAAKSQPMYRFGVSPNKLFDYLYSGKPIIYGINSGAYEPINEANAGLQINPEDPRQLADAILQLYHLPAEVRAEMGANGHRAAVSQYEYGRLAQKLSNVLFGD